MSTGIGLFVTKQLCQKMKGEIRGYSRLGKGSCFVICIPTAPGLPESLRNSDSLVINKLKKKVLMVDDINFNLIVLKKYFSTIGITDIDEAKNGLEALHKYKEACTEGVMPYDVVTMDVEMPIMDGMTAAVKIREFEIEKNLKPIAIFMISGNCGEGTIRKCVNPNGEIRSQAFLKKPVDLSVLRDTIFKYCNRDHHFVNEELY